MKRSVSVFMIIIFLPFFSFAQDYGSHFYMVGGFVGGLLLGQPPNTKLPRPQPLAPYREPSLPDPRQPLARPKIINPPNIKGEVYCWVSELDKSRCLKEVAMEARNQGIELKVKMIGTPKQYPSGFDTIFSSIF